MKKRIKEGFHWWYSFSSAQPQWVIQSFKQNWESSFSALRKKQIKQEPNWFGNLLSNITIPAAFPRKVKPGAVKKIIRQPTFSPSGPPLTVERIIRKTHWKHVVFLGHSIFISPFGVSSCPGSAVYWCISQKMWILWLCILTPMCGYKQWKFSNSLMIKMTVTWRITFPSCRGDVSETCVFFNESWSILNTSNSVIFQTGIHYTCAREEFYVSLLTKLGQIVQEQMMKCPGKQVILRSTLPQYFQGEGGWCPPKVEGRGCSKYLDIQKIGPLNIYVEMRAEHCGLKYMDSASFYVERWDLHMTPKDCTHTCITAGVTVPELALLNSLLSWKEIAKLCRKESDNDETMVQQCVLLQDFLLLSEL